MTSITAPAFTAQSTLKPLGFDAAKLNGLSEKLIRSHWENNYGGSVKALAVVKKQLAEALQNKDTPPYVYNDLKREHLLRTGSVVLHELHFDNLGGDGKADATARSALSDAFGAITLGKPSFAGSVSDLAADPGGSCSDTTFIRPRQRTTGSGITCMVRRPRCHCWSWTCTSTRTRWTLARRQRSTSMHSFRTS